MTMTSVLAKSLFIGLLISLLPMTTLAVEVNLNEEKLALQRERFLAAETALSKGDMAIYQALREELIGYPLLVYLDYQETVKHIDQQSVQGISNRLSRLEGTPLQSMLNNQWLRFLSKHELWQTYLQFSKPGGSVRQQCRRLQAMLKTGQAEQAYSEVPGLWLNGRSQPKVCDPVFKSWIDAGHLTEQQVWQRFNMAMSQRQTRLANYLKRYLSKTEQQIADLWLKLYRQPAKIGKLYGINHPMKDEMAIQIIRKLAWRDVEAAFGAWEKLQPMGIFSDKQQQKAIYALAGGLAREPDKQLSQRFNQLLPEQLKLDSRVSEKALQAALQVNDWTWVLQLVESLSATEKQQAQWQYWHARALTKLDRENEARAILKQLSQERSYYGFMAANQLGVPPKLEHIALQSDQTITAVMALNPGLQRARELHMLKRPMSARREWNLALKKATPEELKAAAHLAQNWNWPSQSIITLAKLRHWNDLELRFPLAHQETITGQARGHGIDRAWVYAILRQESAFISDARSSAGARGLMQLMPKTAKQVAKELKHSPLKLDDLFRPEVNIRLGTGYLNKIYRQLQENPVLATAAYNAGPHRVKSWLPDQTQATDIWIETIPFHETREYLKRVLAYTVIYNYRLGEQSKVVPKKWLTPIEARNAASGV
ncbi:MAG: transglycosylase SLT domain-containing protein [Candidatus Thiodiazotropha sp. (ex. Lucinisca nassula)]|nr:transglycosylase SLT domain-containing protein [Candidatus Thiodiazotropha sp. (ex. Lucinisca nassula)]MBW9259978.1 transglycosylase SLT domain-containing protein [Candidatus Thiodiazotropha sp. (ex. Lucinisca nassula)]MBW9270772.1 transglycosylase SLT domain-containing protein [Candidatus Thiodiazotropha sp. (ex. Lucinisca nassula)]